jgi:hypothetical protein
VRGDTPFERRLFIAMPQPEQEAYLDGIRRRRLATIEAHRQSVEIKQRAKDQRMVEQIDKQSKMMEKELAALDKALEKVEKRAAMLAGLRLLVINDASNAALDMLEHNDPDIHMKVQP